MTDDVTNGGDGKNLTDDRYGKSGKPYGNGERKPFDKNKKFGERKSCGEKRYGDKDGRKPYDGNKKFGERKSCGEKRYGDKDGRKPYDGNKKFGERKSCGDNDGRRDCGDRGERKSYGGRYNDRGGYGKTDRRGRGGEKTDNADGEKPQETAQPSIKIKLRLDVKDVVRPRTAETEPEAEATDDGEFKPTVLFEDNHLLVVVKPQNMPTQGDESGDPDLLSSLKEYLVKKYDKPGEAYLGLLHRLDRPTGGVMVFAKTSKAAARLSEQIRAGDLEKTYAAVVVGRPNRNGRVEHYLLKDEKTNTVTLAPSTLEGVKRAVSDINVVQESGGRSLVSVKLLTGRTHQARVQLKALGSPIAGDAKYGGDKYVPTPHLALWAYRLSFAHPVTGEPMTFLCEPPAERPWSEFNTSALVDVDRPVEHGYNIK